MISINQVEAELFPRTRTTDVRPGDTVRVHVRIEEEATKIGASSKGNTASKGVVAVFKGRIQVFEGTVIAVHNNQHRSTFTVRKMSYGVGVERIFPIDSPNVQEVQVMKRHRVRRAKLYYLRALTGKAARLKEIR